MNNRSMNSMPQYPTDTERFVRSIGVSDSGSTAETQVGSAFGPGFQTEWTTVRAAAQRTHQTEERKRTMKTQQHKPTRRSVSVDPGSDGHGLSAKRAPLLACCLLALSVTGCTSLTVTNVKFAPTVSQPLGATRKAGLVVGEVRDSRALKESEKYVLAYKSRRVSAIVAVSTSGAYVTKEAMADVVRGGLVEALQRNGFMEGTTKYELRGDIQQFVGLTHAVTQEIASGVSAGAGLATEMTVRFDLYDRTTGQSVWHNTCTGRGTTGYSLGMGQSLLEKLFAKATDDLVRQLVSDEALRSYLEQ